MLKRVQAMTVGQSMVLVFLSGIAVALVFALSQIAGDTMAYRLEGNDRHLVANARQSAALVRVFQRERDLTAAQALGDTFYGRSALIQARLDVDALLSEQIALQSTALPTQSVTDQPVSLRRMRAEIAALRKQIDSQDITWSAHHGAMTDTITTLIARIGQSAGNANIGQVATTLRTLALHLSLTDRIAVQGGMTMGAAALPPGDSALRDDVLERLNASVLAADALLKQMRMIADGSLRADLDSWSAMTTTRRAMGLRDALRTAKTIDLTASANQMPEADAAFSAMLEALYRQQVWSLDRTDRIVRARMDGRWRAGVSDISLLLGLCILFGSLGLMTLRQVDKSIKALTRAICHLSIDAQSARIPSCPQGDLNQIADALRVLKAAQIDQIRERAAAEELREKVGDKMGAVLASVAHGKTGQRIELLGMDGHGAVLARGINRLLDQIEDRRETSTKVATNDK